MTIYNLSNPIYDELNCSVQYHSMDDLLNKIEQSSLCQGLPTDDFDVMPVVVDPTSRVTMPGTVLRHSIPKVLTSEQTHMETTLAFRSVDCKVIGGNLKGDQCKPCKDEYKAIKKASQRNSGASEDPAKDKASLAACGPGKFRATIRSDRLHCKQLEERLQNFEAKIEDHGVNVDKQWIEIFCR